MCCGASSPQFLPITFGYEQMPVMEGPSSHSDPRNVSAPMRAMMLGGLAALSGVASNYLPQIGNETLFGVPPLPGVYFGAVVAVGIAA